MRKRKDSNPYNISQHPVGDPYGVSYNPNNAYKIKQHPTGDPTGVKYDPDNAYKIERPPYVRFLGDPILASTLDRQGKQHLLGTKEVAKAKGVETYARKLELSPTSFIHTMVTPMGDFITIYAVSVEPEEVSEEEEVEEKEEVRCPPAFLVYQRNYTGQRDPLADINDYDIPKNEDPNNPGTFDQERRDLMGDLLVYNHNAEAWKSSSIIPEPEEDTEAFYGGWWGLETLAPSLNNSYKKCDLVTWAGCSRAFGSVEWTLWAWAPNWDFLEPYHSINRPHPFGGETPLRTYFWSQARKVHFNHKDDPSDLGRMVVLGVSILADGDTDYYYVLAKGRDPWFRPEWESPDTDVADYIYRLPVTEAHEDDNAIWEYVAEVPTTLYIDDPAPSEAEILLNGGISPGFVSLDGEQITVQRLYLRR
jgi:hypothetical protein